MSKQIETMKIKVALLFGGNSAEHDISIISALQAYRHLDKEKYEVYPVYITKNCEMYLGEHTKDISAYKNIDALIKESEKVNFVRENDRVSIVRCKKKAFKNPFVTYVDVALPVVHGTNAEDGTIQGYLQMLKLPYGGCDIISSAVGMDKFVTKTILREASVPVLDSIRMSMGEYRQEQNKALDKIEESVDYPIIVKPVNCGSSIGISVAHSRNELVNSLDEAFTYSDKILAEKAIVHLREINCSVLGDSDSARASECEEPVSGDEILSFKDKYVNSGASKGAENAPCKMSAAKSCSESDSKGMANLKRILPAPITKEQRDFVRETAVRAFKALGCSGVARIDFLLDSESGEIYFNEINTIPGSLSFYLWEPLGLPYKDLLDEIISLALKRERRNNSLTFSFESSVLSGADFGGAKGAKGSKI